MTDYHVISLILGSLPQVNDKPVYKKGVLRYTLKFSYTGGPEPKSMLQLQQTCTGFPAAGVQHLILQQEAFLVRSIFSSYINYLSTSNQLYASADAVIILNARTLALVRVLAFWEAFPGTMHTKDSITCISIDSGMKLVRQSLLFSLFPIYLPYRRSLPQ